MSENRRLSHGGMTDSRLVQFPKPFPDELLYSLIARHNWFQPLSSLKSLALRAFADRNALAVVDLPARLGSLCSAVGQQYDLSVETVIRNHTLLPFYALFLPRPRLKRIEQDMEQNHGGAVHFRAGIMASKVQPPIRMRFCPACAAEERNVFGEAYWHRLHQIAGVVVCPIHKVFLAESSVISRFRCTRHLFTPAEDAVADIPPKALDMGNPENEILLRIAEGADWLLKNYIHGTDLGQLRQRYVARAMELGFVTGGGRIRWNRLLAEFHRHFSEPLLQILQSPLPSTATDHWLARMLRLPRVVQAPIRHLVFMEFLKLTPQTFFNQNRASGTVKAELWLCDNAVCPKRGRISMVEIQREHSHQHRRPMGVFTCPACGQIRCRVLSGEKEIQWIRDFGPLWESVLAKSWADPAVSVRQIANRLGVDSLTVKRHAAKARLPFPRQGKRISGKKGAPTVGGLHQSRVGDLPKKRSEWLALRCQFPSEGAAQLRQRAPGCYAYLYRHDRRWLRKNCPARHQCKALSERVDWSARDQFLSRQVARARDALLIESDKRISVSALGRRMRALAWIQKHPSKLPATMAQMASAVESPGEFARRRLRHAAGQVLSQLPANAPVIAHAAAGRTYNGKEWDYERAELRPKPGAKEEL